MVESNESVRRLIEEQEHVRKILAYEIHDGVVQDLTGAIMFAESIAVDNLSPEDAKTLDDVCNLMRKSVSELRRIMSGLHPADLEQSGLVTAIGSFCEMSQTRHGVEIAFQSAVPFDRLPDDFELGVFRIAQEAVNNALKHSRAKSIRVAITAQAHEVRIEVIDNGVGFDPKEVDPLRFGLRAIRDRAALLGGKAVIESSRNGTRVAATIPLPS